MPHARPTVQLCSAPQNPAEPKTLRCVLAMGHAGPHEGLNSAGARVKFETAPKPAPKR